jgi:hypothetical protein
MKTKPEDQEQRIEGFKCPICEVPHSGAVCGFVIRNKIVCAECASQFFFQLDVLGLELKKR